MEQKSLSKTIMTSGQYSINGLIKYFVGKIISQSSFLNSGTNRQRFGDNAKCEPIYKNILKIMNINNSNEADPLPKQIKMFCKIFNYKDEFDKTITTMNQ